MQNVSHSLRAMEAGGLLLAAFLVMAGCAPTQVQQVWTDETYAGGRLNSVFIVVLVSDSTTKRMFETEFARYFKYRGIKVIESFMEIEAATFREKDARDSVLAKIREKGSDAVLITRVVDHRTIENVIPGMTITAGYGYGMGGASVGAVYSFSGPSAPTTQSYSHEETFLGLVTSVFDMRTEKILWSIQTETRITGTAQEEIKPYVAIVADKLFKAKLFQ